MSQKQRRFKTIATVIALYSLLTACATWQSIVRHVENDPEPNRGVLVNHELHAAQGLECSDCHKSSAEDRMTFADHNTCSICHDIPENALVDPLTFAEDVSCKKCHTRDDFSVEPRRQLITEEIRFEHQNHVEAQISCAQCHAEPDNPMHLETSLMAECMECHEQTNHTFIGLAKTEVVASDFQANECMVCHRELTRETIPQFRGGQRIAHDSPEAWKRLHGQESYVDAAYCMQCHVEEEDCMTCHRIMKPDSHTLAWNRRVHGAHAAWDSQSCSVCHEEDSCMKCHEHTQPVSHRGSFGAPQNNHCVQCHFPPETSCTICHESIEHTSAPRSPHDAGGGFAGNCALCHPGGIAGTAPHRSNPSISCRTCHQ